MDQTIIPSQDRNTVSPTAKKKRFPLADFTEKHRHGVLPLVLSFLLPLVILLVCLFLHGAYPFGDGQIINYDGWHQYYPFLMRLWEHIHHGTSLFYDWGMGMGTNFLSMISYYATDPLNLLLMLSPSRDFRLLFELLIVVRLSFAGLFCGLFLKKILPTMGWSLALFGTGYALCGYFVGYFWNEMWLTSAALFPLLCLGALKLFREGKASLYIFILGISLFANYYIGYMCAMFIVLEFFILCALFPSSFPNVLRKGFRLLLSTLWGACLGAVLLLPALFGLLNTASTQMATPLYSSFYETMRDLFAPLTSFHQPAVIDGLPNLATTALVTLLVFLFFLAKKIPLREKITAFLVLAFLLFSMNYSVLNYFWHGMHYTNMIPYRFAFVFAFCLVVIAAREYERGLSGFDWVDAVGGILFAGFLGWCAFGLYPNASVLATIFVFASAVIVFTLTSAKILPRRALSGFVCATMLIELCSAAYIGVGAVGFSSYSQYFDGEKGAAILSFAQTVREREADSLDFCRMEEAQWRSLNDSCFYSYNGISQFASSANTAAARVLEGLGMSADPGSNRYTYVHSTPLADTVLGIKYLIARDGYLSDPNLSLVTEGPRESATALYETDAFAGIAFLADARAEEYTFDLSLAPYERQNALFCALTGLEGDLLTKIEPEAIHQQNLDLTREEDGTFSFLTAPQSEDAEYILRLTYRAPQKGMIYCFADVPDTDFVQVNNAWHCVEDYPNFFDAGYFREDERFTLRAVLDEEGDEEFSGTARFDVCVMDQQLWEKGLAILKSQRMRITSFSDTALEGEVTAKENGFLYMSIPVEDRCWTLTVDGKEQEITPFAGALIGVKISAGEHHIALCYRPAGFQKGAWISAIAILLLLCLAIAEKKGFVLFREVHVKRSGQAPKNVN